MVLIKFIRPDLLLSELNIAALTGSHGRKARAIANHNGYIKYERSYGMRLSMTGGVSRLAINLSGKCFMNRSSTLPNVKSALISPIILGDWGKQRPRPRPESWLSLLVLIKALILGCVFDIAISLVLPSEQMQNHTLRVPQHNAQHPILGLQDFRTRLRVNYNRLTVRKTIIVTHSTKSDAC